MNHFVVNELITFKDKLVNEMLPFAFGIYFNDLLNLSYMASWRHIVVCDDIRKNTRLFGAMSTMFSLVEKRGFSHQFGTPPALG